MRIFLALLLAWLASGCTAMSDRSEAYDPWEGLNRKTFAFNDALDRAVLKPVAQGYQRVTPSFVQEGVNNFYGNLEDVGTGLNNFLQGKIAEGLSDTGRVIANTVFGVFGLWDVATPLGLEKHDEDFGQTFGRWGLDDGAYLVWPFLGSSSVRDSVGLIFDFSVDPVLQHKPVRVRNTMTVLRATSKRADLLDASRILEEAALDKYVFQRDAYLQRRRNQVYDGNPPRASREQPQAEAAEPADRPMSAESAAPVSGTPQPLPQPAAAMPVAQPDPAAMEAAAHLLEQPASAAASTGG